MYVPVQFLIVQYLTHGATPPAAAPACLQSNAAPQAPAFDARCLCNAPAGACVGSVALQCRPPPLPRCNGAQRAAGACSWGNGPSLSTPVPATALQLRCRVATPVPHHRPTFPPSPPGYAHRAMRQRRRSLSTPVAAAALQLCCRVATPVTPAPRHRPRGAGACVESVLTPDGAVAPCIARGRSPAPGDAPHHHYHCPAACWGPILLPAAAAILHHPARGPFRRPAPCVTATLPLRCPAPLHKNCPWRRGEAHRLGEHCQVRCRDRLPVCAPQS